MKKVEVKIEKEKNEYFIDWIYKIWHHHDTIDEEFRLDLLDRRTTHGNR